MALSTHSKFYYGLKVTNQNKYIDFQEGANVFVAQLNLGPYTGPGLALEIKKRMDAAGDLEYTVTYDRGLRKFTISSTSNFTLLCATGVNFGFSAYPLLGYTATDKTGASSYLAENATGLVYSTQFYIQSYKPTTQNRKAIDGVVNMSSSGVTEVVRFGTNRYMSGELFFITNVAQESGSVIRGNPTGVDDFISFIEYATDKGPLEFMQDENNVEEYQTLLLESTEVDGKGLDYELIELYDRGLAEYFRSGVLKFKLIS